MFELLKGSFLCSFPFPCGITSQHGIQGFGDPCIFGDKFGVVVAHAQKHLQLFNARGGLDALDCFNFALVHRDTLWSYDVAEVVKFLQPECTFFAFGLEAMLAKLSENPAKVLGMFLGVG